MVHRQPDRTKKNSFQKYQYKYVHSTYRVGTLVLCTYAAYFAPCKTEFFMTIPFSNGAATRSPFFSDCQGSEYRFIKKVCFLIEISTGLQSPIRVQVEAAT